MDDKKMATMKTDWKHTGPDVIERACIALEDELCNRPEYGAMIREVRRRGHRMDYRVIPGPVRDGMLLLTIQIRDGGPTVGDEDPRGG